MTSRTTYDVVCDMCSKETRELMFDDDDDVDYSSTWITLNWYEARGDKKRHMSSDLCSVDCLAKMLDNNRLKDKLTDEQAENCAKYGKVSTLSSSLALLD